MERSKCWSFALAILLFGFGTSIAQSRIQLVQGRRAVDDRVTFVVEVGRTKSQDPRYEAAPEFMQIFSRFADRPATGTVYMDGKLLGRFDESGSFNSNPIEVTYGRHTMTIMFAKPAVVTLFMVDLRGGVLREILEGDLPVSPSPIRLEQRLVELEHQVQRLESEVAALKKQRVQ